MDAAQFDALARAISRTGSRRQVFAALALAGLVVADEARAGPGCKDVNKKCKKAKDCCSGVCKGKKGKKTCKAHDTGGCKAGQQEFSCGGTNIPCTTSSGDPEGVCDTTTGNAGYCTVDGDCFACTKDADCRPFCGPAAACIICADLCAETGGTACAGPGDCSFPPT